MTNFFLLRIAPFLGASLIRFLRATMRIEIEAPPPWEELEKEKGGSILAFWHNRLLMTPFAHGGGRPLAALISRHRDGEIISRTMSFFGVTAIRGSTTRGGTEALRKMAVMLADGFDVGITPDGPRGPLYRVQPGAVALARLSGRPIYPLAISSERFREFRSWDRFRVPRFFSRGAFVWGDPIWVRKGDDLEEKRCELEKALSSVTEKADRRFGERRAGTASSFGGRGGAG